MDVEALRRALERAVGALDDSASSSASVRFDKVSRALYSTDASVYRIEPLGVVLPRTREGVQRVVRVCHDFRCPVTMRGGGTSQAGQAIGAGIQVDTSKHLNRLLEVNVAERWARVEPGIVLDELNAQLRPHGVRFAPDISTASRATVGGMIANNSSGARSVLYGKTIDHVLELHVILSDGSAAHLRALTAEELERMCAGSTLESSCYRTVRGIARDTRHEVERRFPKVLRRVGGYNLDSVQDDRAPFNLAKMIVGSEGTLAVVVEAKIRLVPLPNAKAVLAIEFGDLLQALEATPVILKHAPSAVEVMDRFILDHTKQNPALEAMRRSFIAGDPGALLCVEFYGDTSETLPLRIDALEEELRGRRLGYQFTRALDGPSQARIWSLREAALGLSMAMKDDAKSISFVEDTAVRPELLRDYIERFLAIVRAHGTSAGVYAHASVGCLHVRPVVNLKTAEGVKKFEAIATAVADLVLEFGGALSGEHGDGLVRSPFMEKMYGPVLYDAFRAIKKAFDPHGILNPGKIVDAPPLTSNLRYGAGYETPQPVTWFDYAGWGGMGGAVEMCSGLGVCRKTLEGTMCPSYMATREEAHSTRGRANVLRLAMAGRLGEAGLGDEGVREVLDLCLECRACKTECPVGVDMARFKSEFLADYYTRHGTPLKARALGHVHELARWGSRLAPLSNWLAASGPVRWFNERALGLDRRRPLPAWTRQTLAAALAAAPVTGMGRGPEVVLFNDTFTNFYHPRVGLAAADVLAAAGLRVAVAPLACCGRPLISQGLLQKARRKASAAARRLQADLSDRRPLLFLEPSCLSAIREDAPALLRGAERERAQRLADRAVLFETFLEDQQKAGTHLPVRQGPAKILLHGHCHQKAMGELAPARALLSRLEGTLVEDLDAGCCGMAGSFGYTREHFEISKAIAERKLLPAVRAKDADAVVVAGGTSCRSQVADFAGVMPMHPAELLASLIRPT